MDIRLIKEADGKTWAIAALVILLAVSCAVAWYRGNEVQVVSKTEYVSVPQVKEVVKIKRVEIPIEKVVVLEKEAAAKKLDLPADIKNNPDKQITATAEIPPYEGKTNVLAILNASSGGTTILARQLALPFFDFENKKEIGIRYGASIKNTMEGDLYGRWDFFRVASVHLGLYGEVNTTGDGKAMLQAAYKW